VTNDTKLRNECVVAQDHCVGRDLIIRFWESDSVGSSQTNIRFLERCVTSHTIGRFVSPMDAQLDRFNSRFYTPETVVVVDAFTCSWMKDNNWWVPPVHLVPTCPE